MPTNKEWIFSLSLDELYAWFDAEHVEAANGTLDGARTAFNVTQSDIARQSNVSEDSSDAFTDSREKLEADIEEYLANEYGCIPGIVSIYDEWLDRQAAITRLECIGGFDGFLEARVQERTAELQAQVDSLTKELRKFKDMNNEAGDEIADLECERDYWKQQVQLCMDAAYPQSHSPERRYDPDVMAYPDRNGCTTPSTLVCDVIDGLRDGFQDKMMPILVEAAEAKQDAERWRDGYGRILDEIHEIEGIISELGER